MGGIAFYVLSIGPAARVYGEVENQAVRDALEIIYAPVVWWVNSSDTLQSATLWYVDLWGGED